MENSLLHFASPELRKGLGLKGVEFISTCGLAFNDHETNQNKQNCNNFPFQCFSVPEISHFGHTQKKNYHNKLYTWQHIGTTSDVTLFFLSADFLLPYNRVRSRKPRRGEQKKRLSSDDSIDNRTLGCH